MRVFVNFAVILVSVIARDEENYRGTPYVPGRQPPYPQDFLMTGHTVPNRPLPHPQDSLVYNHSIPYGGQRRPYPDYPPRHNHPPYNHDNPSYNRDHPPYQHDHRPHQHNHPPIPPNFQHNPEYHRPPGYIWKDEPRSDSESNESCCFDDEEEYGKNSERKEYDYNESSKYIPLDFIQDINQYSVNDLLLNFVDGDVEDYKDRTFLSSRFGEGEERSSATIPKAAGCTPEVRTIKLVNSDDPSILYIPQCTKVAQCGGCCSHALLSCQPNQTETLTYQVLKTQYNGSKKLKLLGKEIVLVEKHLSCHCGCRVKEENCNAYQQYRANECRCACTNTDEERKCYKDSSKKLWNPELCACQCRDVLQCSSGYSFDQRECKCVPTPMRRRYAAPVPDIPSVEQVEE